MIYARVEYRDSGRWEHHKNVEAPNVCTAESVGLVEARTLWRKGVGGVRVTVVTEITVLERKRT